MMTQDNTLARYEIFRELGRGATGAVYAARDRTTGAVVALKTLDPALSGKRDASFAERFLKQARSARRLKHRNIVEIHDAGMADGIAYVAMEMLEGKSLRTILDAGPLPIARAIQIAHDIACGLAHAHLEGVVHGGLKPSNVIVLRSGVAKITDFGIGQGMSPEQVRGEPVDHRCDIFSLGALFYEMLAQRPPFEGGSPKALMENILHVEPPPPSALNQHVPRALDGIVSSMLARQPADRMAGVPVLLRELQRLGEGLGLQSAASADEPAASVPPARREPTLRTPAAEEIQHRHRIPDAEVFDFQKAMLVMDRESRPERSSGSRPAIFGALAIVLAVLGIGVAGFMYYSSDPSARSIAAMIRMQEAPATAPTVSRPTAPAPVAEATKDSDILSAPDPIPPKPLAAKPTPLAQPAAAVAAPVQEPPRAMQPTAKVPEQQPGGTARLILAVSPRGEIYIDGKLHGTTPPITTFDLEPGMHRIEVRSGARKPYLTYVTVQAGDVRRLRHDFNAKPIRPPA